MITTPSVFVRLSSYHHKYTLYSVKCITEGSGNFYSETRAYITNFYQISVHVSRYTLNDWSLNSSHLLGWKCPPSIYSQADGLVISLRHDILYEFEPAWTNLSNILVGIPTERNAAADPVDENTIPCTRMQTFHNLL